MSVFSLNGQSLNAVYALNGSPLQAAYNIGGDLIFPHTPVDPSVFLDTAVVTALLSISVSGIKQGACTDGTYIYQIVFDSSAYTSGKFIKYKISDGTYTTTAFDGSVNFGHGNDMCYNPNNQHLFVACMTSDGKIIELDTDFNVIATRYLVNKDGNTYSVWQFCFDRKTNHYLSAHGSNYLVYDQNWNFLSYFDMPTHPDATAQGCETDGDYIYRITYNPNYIDVATVSGQYVKTISLPVSGEPESIMYNWTTREYYIGRNVSSGIFSKVQLKA